MCKENKSEVCAFTGFSVRFNKEMLIKNAKGQIAIFVVLIFQVLFILFAMTINIALVVHDKINFQNSLDLAAYYGAKQQSEVLSAMAHINYQMRQNWKLLAWRYRILGTLAQEKTRPPNADYWCPQSKLNSFTDCRSSQDCHPGPYPNYCDQQYFVCISNDLWKRGVQKSGQNFCLLNNVYIPPIVRLPPPSDYPLGIYRIARQSVGKLIKDTKASCPVEGALNWLTAQMFLTHFRLDQRDRKVMLREIYKQSLKKGRDLDGKSIFEGAKKVFFHNLSQANKKNVQALPPERNYGLSDFHSFEEAPFEELFEYINVWPVLQFLDDIQPNQQENIAECDVKSRQHFDGDLKSLIQRFSKGTHQLAGEIGLGAQALFDLNSKSKFFIPEDWENKPIATLTLGFSKKKDKALYYGLRGEFDYLSRNQIFSLNLAGGVKFRASAFAKPFGGRFGPQPDQSDTLIQYHTRQNPPRSRIINVSLLQPNHSRWPGDKWGLIDRRLHDNNSSSNSYSNFLNKHNDYGRQPVYTIEAFFHLILYEGAADDPLSRPLEGDSSKNTFMRMMELMAVYPDVYDLSYYSIAGNYMQTYFPRICKLLKGSVCRPDTRNKIPRVKYPAYIRGDFGWPDTEYYIGKNYEKKEVELSITPYFLKAKGYDIDRNEVKAPPNESEHSAAILWGRPQAQALTQGRIFYPWLAQELPAHLLSSWVTSQPEDDKFYYDEYEFPEKPFMECGGQALEGRPVPSACAQGGRSSYSVKLISCEAVERLIDEGSKAPEEGLDKYCP